MSDTTDRIYQELSDVVTEIQEHPERSRVVVSDGGPGCQTVEFIRRRPEQIDQPTPAEQPVSDGLSLDDVEKMLSAHPAGLSKGIAEFLIRVVKAMNSRVAELEAQLKGKESDYTGVCLEYQDLSDENNRLKQELEISKIVADARGKTLLELQKELESVKAASVS